jgi:SAM-dependent methyltransferase
MTKLYDDNVDLYDLAFDWNVSEEVAWLHARLGPIGSLLEPGCGSGRILEAFARRGVRVAGVDRSAAMIGAARRRLERFKAELVVADMADFELQRQFDGAVCPLNTVAHLSRGELARHLDTAADHLHAGSRYLVQLDLYDRAAAVRPSEWEMTRGETRLRIAWSTEELDLAAGLQRQRSRIEIVAGARAGEVVEEVHTMTAWTPKTWAAAVDSSPFAFSATYDGDREGRPWAGRGTAGRLLWHELAVTHGTRERSPGRHRELPAA